MTTQITGERRRLIASIGFNLAAKAPSVVSLLFILPLINTALGTGLYGEFLSMLALGSAFTLFFGGINVVARRELAAAHSAGSPSREATVVWNALVCALIAALFAGSIVFVISRLTVSRASLTIVALLPIVAAFANTFDNLRAAYNQHYITAIFQTGTQVAIYGYVILTGIPSGSLVLSALVLHLPFFLASILTFAGLLWEKPHIRTVRTPREIHAIFGSAIYVTLSDGAIFTALNASLYFLGASGAVEIAAWYGTLTRAFQTLLTPILLVMLPLSSFLALKWNTWSEAARTTATNLIALVSLGYGVVAAAAMMSAGDLYLRLLFPTVPRYPFQHLACLGVFFGAILTQKLYTQLIYSVAKGQLLSAGIFLAVLFGFLVALTSSVWLEALNVIDFFAIGTGIPLFASIIAHQLHRGRKVQFG